MTMPSKSKDYTYSDYCTWDDGSRWELIDGAPDLIVEVLSPSTAKLDRFIKFQKYLRSGVRGYWIVDPDMQTVEVCILRNGEYTAHKYMDSDSISISALEVCVISLKDVFVQ